MSGGLFLQQAFRSSVVSLLSAQCRIFVFFDPLRELAGHDLRKLFQLDLRRLLLGRPGVITFRIELLAVNEAEAVKIIWQLPRCGLAFFDDPEAFQGLIVDPVLDFYEVFVLLGVLASPGWAARDVST